MKMKLALLQAIVMALSVSIMPMGVFAASLIRVQEPDCSEGHTYQITVTANCWSGGWDLNVCSVCGDTELDGNGNPVTYGYRSGLGHDFGPPQKTENPLWDIVYCQRERCGHSEYRAAATDPIDDCEHDYQFTNNATCFNPGIIYNQCAKCDEYELNEGGVPKTYGIAPILQHIFGKPQLFQGIPGYWVVYCERGCGYYTMSDPPDDLGDDCDHDYILTVTANCWSGGWDINVCSICVETEVDESGNPVTYGYRSGLGHDFGPPQKTPNPLWDIVYCQREGCEHSEYRAAPICEHVWVKGETTAPTCTEKGYTIYICSICDEIEKRDEVSELSHNLITVTVEATCEVDGRVTTTCSRCDYNDVIGLEKLGHNLNTVTVETTCEVDGRVTTTCSRCDFSDIKVLEKLGHNLTTVTVNATCETDGSATTTCSRCDYSDVIVYEKLGHGFVFVGTVETTDIEEGYDLYECTICGEEEKRFIGSGCGITGHKYVRTVNAVCWSGGWDTNVCSRCEKVEFGADGQPITYGWRSALGHDYELIIRTVANCWVGGGDFVKCKRCGYDDLINWYKGLGHNFGTPQSTSNPIWNIVYCERGGCSHSEYRAARR